MEDKVLEETVKKVGFIKKHSKGFKRGLIAVGSLAGLAIAGAIINNKKSGSEDEFVETDEEYMDRQTTETSDITTEE